MAVLATKYAFWRNYDFFHLISASFGGTSFILQVQSTLVKLSELRIVSDFGMQDPSQKIHSERRLQPAMDPVSAVGITASVIPVMQLTASCLKWSRKFIGPSQYLSGDPKSILVVLDDFNGSIMNLRTHLKVCEEDEARISPLEYLQRPLSDSKRALCLLEDHMKHSRFMRRYVVGNTLGLEIKGVFSSAQAEQKPVLGRSLCRSADDSQQCRALCSKYWRGRPRPKKGLRFE